MGDRRLAGPPEALTRVLVESELTRIDVRPDLAQRLRLLDVPGDQAEPLLVDGRRVGRALWARLGMPGMAIHITGDEAADQVLTDSSLALLVGMMLDQRVCVNPSEV